MTYARYMSSRAFKVNPYADVEKISQRYVPWVSYEHIKFKADDLKLIFDRPVSKECEDNPLWYVKGDEECK